MIDLGQRDPGFLAWLDEHGSVSSLAGSAFDSSCFDVQYKEYLELVAVRDRLCRLGETLSAIPGWGDKLETALQEEIEPIRDRLYELAVRIAQSQATSMEQIRGRSRVLADLCDEKPDDVVTRLTAALCRDLYLLSSQSSNSE